MRCVHGLLRSSEQQSGAKDALAALTASRFAKAIELFEVSSVFKRDDLSSRPQGCAYARQDIDFIRSAAMRQADLKWHLRPDPRLEQAPRAG